MEGFSFGIAFDEFSELLQPLTVQYPAGIADASSSEWVALLHAHEPVPHVHNVIEAQEYLAKIGQDAQLAILSSSNGNIWHSQRIEEIVRLGNQRMVEVDQLCEQGNEAQLNKYVVEMRRIIKNELVAGLSKGPVLES